MGLKLKNEYALMEILIGILVLLMLFVVLLPNQKPMNSKYHEVHGYHQNNCGMCHN
jgi:competence protein ComGC